MSSDEHEESDIPASWRKNKRPHQTNKISVESSQQCIASAMAKIINRMVNKELQQHCKELLEMEDLAETEARILFILQQIDRERVEEEKARKAKCKKRK